MPAIISEELFLAVRHQLDERGQENKDTEDAVEALWCSPARYLWAMLLARIYESAPLACPQCGSDMRIIAFVTDGVSVRGILEHIGEPADPPRIAPARPTWRFFAKYRVCVSSESPLRLSLLRSRGQVLSRFRDLMAKIEVV